MKVCNACGEEISTPDGDNFCAKHQHLEDDDNDQLARQEARESLNRIGKGLTFGAVLQAKPKKRRKSARQEALESLGLVKVRGAMGGTYYE